MIVIEDDLGPLIGIETSGYRGFTVKISCGKIVKIILDPIKSIMMICHNSVNLKSIYIFTKIIST